MSAAEMWEVLQGYGITTMDEFTEALKNSKGINIGVFTEGRKNYDSEGISDEAERRVTA